MPYPQQQPQQPSNVSQGINLGGKVLGTVARANNPATSAATGVLGTVGKVMPWAGAATGIMGLMKNRGTLGNIGNGFTAGASIGSIVPGLGTLVGGGIGAAVGALRGAFHGPSQQELQGRQAGDAIQQALSRVATPQQLQEAQNGVRSGAWHNVNAPLQHIVLRDSLIKQGYNPQQAEAQAGQWEHGLWAGTKQGGNAVMQAFSPIQALLSKTYGR